MRTVRAIIGWLVVLAASSPWVGCMRLSEHDSYACHSQADCTSDEHCDAQGRCQPKGTCDSFRDCEPTERCLIGKCASAECYPGHEAACAPYRCLQDRTCSNECVDKGDCQSGLGCDRGSCVPPGTAALGVDCKLNKDCESLACCGPSDGKICVAECGRASDTCEDDTDCESGHCCASGSGRHSCSTGACKALELGATCASSSECQTGACLDGRCACETDEQCADGYCDGGTCHEQGLAPGEACKSDAWCDSYTCLDGVCRGTAEYKDSCAQDVDCVEDSICCTNAYTDAMTCSEQGRGCAGANGDQCTLGGADKCLSGMCLDSTLCTQACKTDADCGTSPWGSKNRCRKNDVGDFICFPSCSSQDDCNWISDFFDCDSGVCAGGEYSASDLRLWEDPL